MKTLKNQTLYFCDHCGKLYRRPGPCKVHEESKCSRNPGLQPKCFGCKHFSFEKMEIVYDRLRGGDHVQVIDTIPAVAYCALHEEYMQLPWKRLHPEVTGMYMPLECEDFQPEPAPVPLIDDDIFAF